MLVIHVEDDPLSQDFVRKVLQSNHYDVLAFDSAAKALKSTRLHQADMILIDYNLPGGPDGLVLSKRLRTFHPEIPIIMVSSYAQRNEIIQAFRMGVKDFLIKPFSPEQLLQAIGEALLGQNLAVPVEEPAHRQLGPLQVDLEARSVAWYGQALSLTRSEYQLLVGQSSCR